MQTVGEWWMWVAFGVLVLVAIAVDLVVLRAQGAHKVSMREAGVWTLVWFSLALAFCAALWFYLGHTHGREVADEKAAEFLTGYLIEWSLSIDNIFVFLMLFGYFGVPPEFQKRVIIFGIVGAIVLRVLMILAGAVLIARFHWILYLFGLFLIVTGVKMWLFADAEPDLETNPVLVWMRRHLRVTSGFHGESFWITQDGVRWFTPLFLVMVLVGVTDIIFAVDSIPAIFAITSDPFIVVTANVCAVLGLRALFFLLAGMKAKFHLLSYGLAVVLVFVGAKMLLADVWKVPITWSLLVVLAIIVASATLSLLRPPPPEPADASASD